MKTKTSSYIGLILLLLIGSTTQAQQLPTPEEIKWDVFKEFTESEQELIQANWKQYHTVDFTNKLIKDENLFPLSFDSYGLAYPDYSLLTDIDFKIYRMSALGFMLYNNVYSKSYLNNNRHHFYSILKDEGSNNLATFKRNAEKSYELGEIDKAYYEGIKMIINRLSEAYYKKQDPNNNNYNAIIRAFNKDWNRLHFPRTMASLLGKIDEGAYSKVLFFAHGYNVPHSLAAIQLSQLKKSLEENDIDTRQMLFVPVYWPSNDQKQCEIASSEAFSIADEKGLKTGGFPYLYISNAANFAGISLRKVLNQLPENVYTYLSSHSMGATVITTALINVYPRIDYGAKGMNELLFEGFEEQIPQRPASIFLSAPGIPGTTSFSNIAQELSQNKQFFATLNSKDKVLNKDFKKWAPIQAEYLSSTSLGCTPSEAMNVKLLLAEKGIDFQYEVVDAYEDHSFVTYLSQERYSTHLKNFINSAEVVKLAANISKDEKTSNLVHKPNNTDSLLSHFTLIKNNLFSAANRSLIMSIVGWDSTQFNLKRKYINTIANPLRELLYQAESSTTYAKEINPTTRQLISSVDDPYILILIERAIEEDESDRFSIAFKKKINQVLSQRLYNLMNHHYAFYNYDTEHKDVLKFIHLETGNDLFTNLTSDNLDRDYTGSFKLAFGTDYLNPLRRRPIKSYQSIFYGFDVFTPSFYDSLKFTDFDSYDSLDRPHASFQYFGWSKNALSKNDRYRWSTTIKIGQIGGRIGEQFQTKLHQDISFSARPKGWDAQIADGGRIGFSLENSFEWQLMQPIKSRFPLIIVGGLNTSIGHYRTSLGTGISLTNKTFSSTNQNAVHNRQKQSARLFEHLLFNAYAHYNHIFYDGMLEGYGIFNNVEAKNDELTPESDYVLTADLVNRNRVVYGLKLSYTTRYATLFIDWRVYTPDTLLGDLQSQDDDPRLQNLNIGERNHHFGLIGLSFNIRNR